MQYTHLLEKKKENKMLVILKIFIFEHLKCVHPLATNTVTLSLKTIVFEGKNLSDSYMENTFTEI